MLQDTYLNSLVRKLRGTIKYEFSTIVSHPKGCNRQVLYGKEIPFSQFNFFLGGDKREQTHRPYFTHPKQQLQNQAIEIRNKSTIVKKKKTLYELIENFSSISNKYALMKTKQRSHMVKKHALCRKLKTLQLKNQYQCQPRP